MRTKVKSALIGAAIGIPLTIYAIGQQSITAEAYSYKSQAGVILVVEKEPVAESSVDLVESIENQVETSYYDVPLSEELQDHIFSVCESYDFPVEIVIAIIERESMYDSSAVGDSGASKGLMQIQSKWHRERMDRLGCDDLLDPMQNVTVGVDFLAELSQVNSDIYWVLMAYNGGMQYANDKYDRGEYSEYAVEVVEKSKELHENSPDRREVEQDYSTD